MPDLWRPALADFVQAAAVILDIDPDRIQRLPGLRLADGSPPASRDGRARLVFARRGSLPR